MKLISNYGGLVLNRKQSYINPKMVGPIREYFSLFVYSNEFIRLTRKMWKRIYILEDCHIYDDTENGYMIQEYITFLNLNTLFSKNKSWN